jgi:phosphatidylglycerol:prolipoprotein diacylglycerol transferase
MFPDPLHIGPINVQPMGVAWAIGFLLAFWLALKRGRKSKIPEQLIINLSILVLVSSLVGAKLFYAFFHWDNVTADPGKFLTTMSGSGVFGAILLSVPTALLYLHEKNESVWQVLDVAAPSWAVMEGFGRMGCFASGCCFGKPTESAIGLAFPANSPAGSGFPGMHVLPTQLFSAGAAILILGVGLLVDRRKSFHGTTFFLVLFLYSVGRFMIDFFRFYESEMMPLSISGYQVPATQWISLAMAILASMILKDEFDRTRRTKALR